MFLCIFLFSQENNQRMDDRIIPEDFVCPITKDVMEDPVLANDGYTYERIAIMQYVVNEGKSPMTRQEMNEAQLMPNRALKSIIEKWRTEEEANNELQEAMNEDIYFDVETKLCKYKNTNELVSSECVFVFINVRKSLKYKGSVKEGKLNGKGIFYFPNGKKLYEGDFSDGKAHGKGIEFYQSGEKSYEGDYSQGKRHGQGIVFFNNNKKQYEGELSENKRHGKGVHYYHDKEGYKEYEGDWFQDKYHGKGMFYEKNGKKSYEGDFSDGKPHGKGIEFDQHTGEKSYEGEYSQGKRHAHGIEYYHDKEGYKKYEGDWFQDYYHGKGIIYFKNNTKQYEGYWSKNKWHGRGIEYYGKHNNNKKKKEGLWSQGKFKSGTFIDKEGIEFLSKDVLKLQKLASLLNVHRRTSKRTRKTIKVNVKNF